MFLVQSRRHGSQAIGKDKSPLFVGSRRLSWLCECFACLLPNSTLAWPAIAHNPRDGIQAKHRVPQDKRGAFRWMQNSERFGLYRPSYAEPIAKCQQIKQRNWKLSKFLKPYPERLISLSLLLMPSTTPLVVRFWKYPVTSPNHRQIVPTLSLNISWASANQSSNFNVPSPQSSTCSKIVLNPSFCWCIWASVGTTSLISSNERFLLLSQILLWL